MRQTQLTIPYRPLECRPDSYYGWYHQGNLLRMQGHYQEALISYENALEYYPNDYWAWYKRGMTLEELGRYQEAVTSYENASEIQPNNYWAWYDQGCVYLEELKEYEKAIEMYERIKNEYKRSNEGRSIDKYIARAKFELNK